MLLVAYLLRGGGESLDWVRVERAMAVGQELSAERVVLKRGSGSIQERREQIRAC